ncbi:MAG TPA: hypothetical protein GX400_01155 [Chloroflexi bacterium]|nr:hypothetical protein [Chloroflexota bacterium]
MTLSTAMVDILSGQAFAASTIALKPRQVLLLTE